MELQACVESNDILFSLLPCELLLRIFAEPFHVQNAQSTRSRIRAISRAYSIAIEVNSLYIVSTSRKFDSIKIFSSLQQLRIIYDTHVSEASMRKWGKFSNVHIPNDLKIFYLYYNPPPQLTVFPLIIWQQSQLHGAYPTNIRA